MFGVLLLFDGIKIIKDIKNNAQNGKFLAYFMQKMQFMEIVNPFTQM